MSDILPRLFAIIEDRKINPKRGSYVNSLLRGGEDEILRKIGEETVETLLAAKSEGDHRVVEEVADLVFHLLVLMASRDITLDQLHEELEERFGNPRLPEEEHENHGNGGKK